MSNRPIQSYNNLIDNILDYIKEAYIQVNREWIITGWNTSAARVFSITNKAPMGTHLMENWPGVFSAIYAELDVYLLADTDINQEKVFESKFEDEDLILEIKAILNPAGISLLVNKLSRSKQTEWNDENERLKCEAAFEKSPLPKWIYDLETLQFLDVNQAAVDLYGYSKEEFLKMKLKDIRTDEEKVVLDDIIQNQIKKDMTNQSLVIHKRKNGEELFVSVKGTSMYYNDKAARMVFVVDLTGLHTIAGALASSEQRFKLLVQDGSDLVTIFDQQGVYKFASPTAARVLGVEPELLIGKNVFDFVHPEDRETARLQFKLVETQNRVIMPPFRYRHFNGETRWMETIITNRLNDPVIKGIITNSRDVTERILQEIERKKILDRFNTVSKATSDTIWDLNLTTSSITWNKGLQGLFGYKLDFTTLDWWKSKVHPDDLERILAHFVSMIKQGLAKSKLEYRFQCANGKYKAVFDRSYIQYDEHGRGNRIIGSMQDVTEQKRYIAEIEVQNAKLREISFIQSHKLRAPLAAFMGLISLIDTKDKDPETFYEIHPMLLQTAKEIDIVIRTITEEAER
ncbi:PAS domain-containing protein [Pedobacter insulae]|uniref:histidine kinase n=1 Tax=Pedobacter insulae TaxID=414048 RepID=A0A1I2Y6A3_9SPHI|nr:PAS domain-containing protein [Pedobacter insulae]SFH19871.1 PAS domain S-box-containing protein [Pedobacter insulae]